LPRFNQELTQALQDSWEGRMKDLDKADKIFQERQGSQTSRSCQGSYKESCMNLKEYSHFVA